MTRTRILIGSVATLIAFLALTPAHHAQGRKNLSMSVAYVQEGAPVQLQSVTFSVEFLFSKAEVKNVSNHTVRSVTFGVLLSEPNGREFVQASKQEVPTNIKPAAVREVDVLDLPVNEAEHIAAQFQSSRVIASFGVLAVRFDDGTSWSFTPTKDGGFNQGSSVQR